jgi:hypothetical protein
LNIFATLTKGDSATWNDASFTDTQGKPYDSSAYTLTYEIRGAVTLTLTAVGSGSGWKTSITTTQSNTLTPGTYYWAAYVSKTGERVTAGTGTLVINADLAAASAGYSGASQEETDLQAIKAEISARVSGGLTLEYTIGNRSLKKEPLTALLELKDRYERLVRRQREAEMVANGLGNPRRVMVRFTGN